MSTKVPGRLEPQPQLLILIRIGTSGVFMTSIRSALEFRLDDVARRRASQRRFYLVEGKSDRQDDHRDANSCLRAPRNGEKGPTSLCRKPRRRAPRNGGIARRELDENIEVFELVPPENLLDDDQQQSLLIPQTRAWRDDTSAFSRWSKQLNPSAWCSTACRRFDCWPKARFVPASNPCDQTLFRQA